MTPVLFLLHVCLPWRDGSGALITNHPMGLQRRQKLASMGCVEIHLWSELGVGSLSGRRPEGSSTDVHGKKKQTHWKGCSLPFTVSSEESCAGTKHVGGSSPVGPLSSSLLIGFNIILTLSYWSEGRQYFFWPREN